MEIDHLDLVVREAGQISVREAQSEGNADRYRIALHHLAVFFRDPSGIKLEIVHSPG